MSFKAFIASAHFTSLPWTAPDWRFIKAGLITPIFPSMISYGFGSPSSLLTPYLDQRNSIFSSKLRVNVISFLSRITVTSGVLLWEENNHNWRTFSIFSSVGTPRYFLQCSILSLISTPSIFRTMSPVWNREDSSKVWTITISPSAKTNSTSSMRYSPNSFFKKSPFQKETWASCNFAINAAIVRS